VIVEPKNPLFGRKRGIVKSRRVLGLTNFKQIKENKGQILNKIKKTKA
jgi:hypothetical protein